ncbi:hypothetical protein ACHHYP_12285 [Achlya hypogyna]|uniref:peptidylprolyl isomerase n=1 Tax=Achlya hypogyna TaxID=1202772 RepID=A0A1V9YHA8_ACHHY|nr:hypothetical protein ACHHYP_12285 [Achlya hypogyna]
MDAAAAKIQCIYRSRVARRQFREMLQTVIQRYYDADSGMYYYYNSVTNSSTWVKPRILGQDEACLGIPEAEPNIISDEKVDSLPTKIPEEAVRSASESDAPPLTEDDHRRKSQLINADAENPFSPDELRMIEAQFKKFDSDGSGSISLDELTGMLQSFGDTCTKDDVKNIVLEVDANSDGQINLSEFITILHHQRERDAYCPSIELALMFGPDEIANLRKQFQMLDTDSSGEIDETELATLMKNLGQDPRTYDIKAVIKEVDRDGNGSINFNEFCHIVYNMRNQSKTKFAALLALGVAKGLMNDLGNVLASTKQMVSMWWNANRIAEEKRLRAKRERERELERLRLEKEAKERQIYEDELDRLDALERERLTIVPGLRHDVLLEGDKENYPHRGQYARVHYVGAFENGKVFESSRTRGGALEFKVGCGHVIEAWDVALLRMSVGETAKITCAPKLAYGVKGRPPKIPGNATLVFTIELIAIKEKVQQDGEGSDDEDE